MNPKISVITINFNNKYGLEKTLESVTSQDYTDYEYIVIDGDSTDGSKDLLETYSKNIAYWVSEPDKGIYHAMNKGIAAAKGEYLIFINSGDHFYHADTLSSAEQFLSQEDIIYGNLEVVQGDHKYLKNYSQDLTLFYFFYESLPHPATFIRRDAFEKYGFYDEQLKIVADWKWFMIAICKQQASYRKIDKTISAFYLDGISSNAQNLEKIANEKDLTFSIHFPFITDDLKRLKFLQDENKRLQNAENKFNYLKNYRVIKLLHRLGLIKIPK